MRALLRLMPLLFLAVGLGSLWLAGSASPYRKDFRPRVLPRAAEPQERIPPPTETPEGVPCVLPTAQREEDPLGVGRYSPPEFATRAVDGADAPKLEGAVKRYARVAGEGREGADEVGGILNVMSQEESFFDLLTSLHEKMRRTHPRPGDEGFMRRSDP